MVPGACEGRYNDSCTQELGGKVDVNVRVRLFGFGLGRGERERIWGGEGAARRGAVHSHAGKERVRQHCGTVRVMRWKGEGMVGRCAEHGPHTDEKQRAEFREGQVRPTCDVPAAVAAAPPRYRDERGRSVKEQNMGGWQRQGQGKGGKGWHQEGTIGTKGREREVGARAP